MVCYYTTLANIFSRMGVSLMAVRKDKERVPVTLKKDFKKKLEEIAKKDNRTIGNFIEKILLDWYEENNIKDV